MANAIEELMGLLAAAAGEPTGSLHTKLGRWRQRVSESLGSVIVLVEVIQEQQSHPPPAAPGTFVQTEMSSEGGGQPLGLNTDVKFDAAGNGDIPYNPATGFFRLAPLAAYRLTAHFSLGNYSGETVNVYIEWVDATTNLPLRVDQGALCTPGTNTNSINANPTAEVVVPAAGGPRDVKCRVTATLGTATALAGACYAIVQEI